MSNLKTHYRVELDFDHHTWGKRSFHGNKRHKDNKLQSLDPPPPPPPPCVEHSAR